MPKISKETAKKVTTPDGTFAAFGEIADYTVAFESYDVDLDTAPLFRGLPDDRCQAPHWGYVLRGKIGFQFADHEETFEAGDAYYVGPGHTIKLHAGTEILQFSKTAERRQTADVVERNVAERTED